MAENDYKFPDELENEPNLSAAPEEPEFEIEIEDDVPEEDRKNAAPMPQEIVDEVENDDLSKYADEAKQRLLQMKKMINDERRAKEQAIREQEEAVRVAQSLLEKTKDLQGKLSTGEKAYVDTVKDSVTREIEIAKRAYKEAYDSGDSELLAEAQLNLTNAQLKQQQIANYRPQYDENALQHDDFNVKIPQTQQQPQRLDPKTQAWLDKNSWYGTDEDMSFLAMGIHRRLEKEGVPAGSDHYWSTIDAEMRRRFPDKFAGEVPAEESKPSEQTTKKPTTVVAPASRSTSPKKVRLTNTQLALAKKFRLTPEQYAMELTKLEK